MLSTAETGLRKTLYTKISPSSEVVPAGGKKRKHRDHKKLEMMKADLSQSICGWQTNKCDSVITVNKQYAGS